MSFTHRVGVGCASAVTLLLWPAAAQAHGLSQRADLPIPLWLFAWGAALVLVVSFACLVALWQRPRLQDRDERRLVSVPVVVEVIAGVAGIAAFAFLVYAGFAGSQTPTANITPTLVFVVFWIGVPLVSVLLGDVFALVNPWRAVARGVGWGAGRVGRLAEPLRYPERLGRWPAAAGVVAFAWVELVYVSRDDPSTLSLMALSYAAVMLVGMSLYGVETWTRNADPFAVLFSVYARMAPLDWREGQVLVRAPLSGLPRMPTPAGTVPLICAMIGTTTFDGFSQGSLWTGERGLAQRLTDAWADVGLGPQAAVESAYTVGLVVVVLLIAGLYRVAIVGMRSVSDDRDLAELGRLFVHTLVPISLAYLVAHYFSLVLFQGQALGYFISDPLGTGADLFGTAANTIDYNAVSANAIWYIQVAALVVGHVAALALAHDRALALWGNTRTAMRSQYWMLTVMVAFTCLGLWILSDAAQ